MFCTHNSDPRLGSEPQRVNKSAVLISCDAQSKGDADVSCNSYTQISAEMLATHSLATAGWAQVNVILADTVVNLRKVLERVKCTSWSICWCC